jgi:hypothetical protein
MKLFNKTIDRQLFKQYTLGSDLSKQEVVVKIFNPVANGTWFVLNSDPEDPDYLWAIVDLGYGAEIGSVSRSELENYRGRFGLGFERDLSFDPINADELYKELRAVKHYADGGALGAEVVLAKGYGYYDLSKYSYGNDFKRFLEPTKGKFIKGTIKTGGQIRVLLDDGREIITDKIAIYLPTFTEKDELYQQNKHLFSFGYADGGGIDKNADLYGKDVSELLFLKNKGYKQAVNMAYSFMGLLNDLKMTQGINLEGAIGKNLGIAYFVGLDNNPYEETQISREMLEGISHNSKSANIVFYTNAGVDLHSKEKGVYKNIKVVRVPFDKIKIEQYADGGNLEDFSDNQRMIMNQNVEVEHHQEELEDILEDKVSVPAWVVAKMETATQNLSDITHYLDGQKELMEDENEGYGEFDYSNLDDDDDDEIENKEVVEPINTSAETKAELAKKFTEDAWGNLRGFLKGMKGIDLRDDYTFDYNDEQYEVEPIINSDENGVSNAVFTIFDGDSDEVGEIQYSSDGGKQKFTANSDFFGWNNTKFEDGGFMANVYAEGGKVGSLVNTNEWGDVKNYTKDLKKAKEECDNYIKTGGLESIVVTDNDKMYYVLARPIHKLKAKRVYANGGEIAKAEILGFSKNVMGTTDIEMKITGMRKPQDFIVYPIGKDDAGSVITIQSDTRIGQINLVKGVGVMSQSHSSGAYFVHLQMDKLTSFTISESDLENIKAHIFKTAGDNVGTRGIVSDNSGASRVYADGGDIDVEYWLTINKEFGKSKWQSQESQDFNEVFNEVIGVYNRMLDLYDEPKVTSQENKQIKELAQKFFKIKGFVTFNIVEGMANKIIKPRLKIVYYSNGGDFNDFDGMGYAKTKGRESVDWDKELREYAGSNYSKLTEREKENIISDLKRDWDRSNSYANGGGIGFIPMALEQDLSYVAKWGGTDIKGVIGILNAMIDSGMTDEDLKPAPTKTGFAHQKAIDKKTEEIWNKIKSNYKGNLEGNMYWSTIHRLVDRANTPDEILKRFKPYRQYQKDAFANGGNVLKQNNKVIIAVYKEKCFGYIDPELPNTFFVLSCNSKDTRTTILSNDYHINSPEDYRLANIKDFEDYRIYYPQYTEEEYLWDRPKEMLESGGSLPFMTDPNFGNFQNTGMFAKGGSTNKTYKKGDKVTTEFGTYYVDGADPELQKVIELNKGEKSRV